MPRIVHAFYSEELFNCPDFSSICNLDGNCRRQKCRFKHVKPNPRDRGSSKEKKFGNEIKKREEDKE